MTSAVQLASATTGWAVIVKSALEPLPPLAVFEPESSAATPSHPELNVTVNRPG
jgi:hypothetical protein